MKYIAYGNRQQTMSYISNADKLHLKSQKRHGG